MTKFNKRHKVSNLVISYDDWSKLTIEDQGYYIDTVGQVNHTLLDISDYLEFYD